MEILSKSYALTAWTDNGQVRMIPSLVDKLRKVYENRIAKLESQNRYCEYDELDWLLSISEAWEKYGKFHIRHGDYNAAYRCYIQAAYACAECSDGLEMDGILPHELSSRLCVMYNQCIQLVRLYPALRDKENSLTLRKLSRWAYPTRRETEEEFRESQEYMKAWNSETI